VTYKIGERTDFAGQLIFGRIFAQNKNARHCRTSLKGENMKKTFKKSVTIEYMSRGCPRWQYEV